MYSRGGQTPGSRKERERRRRKDLIRAGSGRPPTTMMPSQNNERDTTSNRLAHLEDQMSDHHGTILTLQSIIREQQLVIKRQEEALRQHENDLQSTLKVVFPEGRWADWTPTNIGSNRQSMGTSRPAQGWTWKASTGQSGSKRERAPPPTSARPLVRELTTDRRAYIHRTTFQLPSTGSTCSLRRSCTRSSKNVNDRTWRRSAGRPSGACSMPFRFCTGPSQSTSGNASSSCVTGLVVPSKVKVHSCEIPDVTLASFRAKIEKNETVWRESIENYPLRRLERS